MRCILASASARRVELLKRAGIVHEQRAPSDALERQRAEGWQHLEGAELAPRLALLKALCVARGVASGSSVVIGADTVAVLGGRVLGKPRDRAEALEMLQLMAGRSHEIITGLALLFRDDGSVVTAAVTSRVTLAPADAQLFQDYIDAGLADGKAGAYGIQDPLFAPMVESLEGPLDNVIGLPIDRLKELMETRGRAP